MDTVKIELDGSYAGWTIELRRNVSARILIELQGDTAVQFAAFAKLVVSHNFKDIEGNAADDILDAPVTAITAAMEKWAAAISALPNA
jgi:predicted RNase H-like nuclease